MGHVHGYWRRRYLECGDPAVSVLGRLGRHPGIPSKSRARASMAEMPFLRVVTR